jgi:hypothetical protein
MPTYKMSGKRECRLFRAPSFYITDPAADSPPQVLGDSQVEFGVRLGTLISDGDKLEVDILTGGILGVDNKTWHQKGLRNV